jgi:hypothetical protein
MANLPYASSEAGQSREKEIRDCLRGVGASAVGFMVDEDLDQIICQFRLGGREITVPVSIGAYASAWKRAMPRGSRTNPADYERKARSQAERAVWGVLADWIKAQAAMIVCGFVDTDTAFLPHIHAADGGRLIDHIKGGAAGKLLPPPPKQGG